MKFRDVDTQEYNEEKIGTMLHKIKRNTSILQALSATKHESIIEEYATMESIYEPPSKFSKGVLKAMECIVMMVLEAVHIGFCTNGAQDYKLAKAVIDEETGEVMNLENN